MQYHNILITGGAGFIGSNFIHFLFETLPNIQDINIINVDQLTYAGNLGNLENISKQPNYFFYKQDIVDTPNLVSIFEKHQIDCVVHFAAESHVDRSILGSREFVMTNVVGTQSVLECVKNCHVKRLIHISTDEVYGALGPTGKFTEQTPIKPNSPYSASKAGADLLVRSYIVTHKIPGITLNCSNNYGPYQFPEKLIPLLITNAFENKPIPVYGKGENIRDWIHTRDFSRAILTAIQHGQDGETYNVGGDNEVTNLELVKKILYLIQKPESLITFVKDRPGHDFRYAVDYQKIKNQLGWEPQISLDQGLSQTIEWYRSHTDWWQKIKDGTYRDYYQKQYSVF